MKRSIGLRLFHHFESRCCFYGYTYPGYRTVAHKFALFMLKVVWHLNRWGLLPFVEYVKD